MSYAANADDDRPRGPGSAYPYRHGPYFWHPGLIALMILGFIFWWPLGLATLFFILWSKGMICWSHGGAHWQHKMERMQEKMDRMRGKMERFGSGWGGPASSGNRAFDEYRAETLRRLEEEQREFREFLDRLRFARDKTEFDQFMAERRARSASPPPPPAQS
jgi:Protein of unknown function (DUF2852)